ncbi:MAG: nucleotidyltransferase family protein [Acidobacteriota bacterium]
MRNHPYHTPLELLGLGPETQACEKCADPFSTAPERILSAFDRAGMSLYLLETLESRGQLDLLPISVQERLRHNLRDNIERGKRILEESLRINSLLLAESVRYLNLKGLSLSPDFVTDLRYRVQYDHDFLVHPDDMSRAYQLVQSLGYVPLRKAEKVTTDHLPTLVKSTGWTWKNNLYDPAIPAAVELHFQLWDSDFDRIPIESLARVWEQSILVRIQGIDFPVLSRELALLYHTLHALRHLLRNDLRLSHLYEIARFLNHFVNQNQFWEQFASNLETCPKSREGVAAVFALSKELFHGGSNRRLLQWIERELTDAAACWIHCYGRGEALDCYRKSKSGLLLHLSMVGDLPSRLYLIRRRLFPLQLPSPAEGRAPQADRHRLRSMISRRAKYFALVSERCVFHAGSVLRFLLGYPRWLVQLYFWRRPSI